MEPPNHPSSEILHDFSPRIRVYKDGRVERLIPDTIVLPSLDSNTGVRSKDINISSSLSARIYVPSQNNNPMHEITKLPLLIYFHGGAFCLCSASSSVVHNYLNLLVSTSNVIALSVDYRLAPEHPVPACYEDAWTAVRWVAAHANGSRSGFGCDPWLAQWADLGRVYIGGESAGANIVHDVLVRAGPDGLLGPGVVLSGAVLIHPFFGDGKPDKLWEFVCPSTTGVDDPRLNPMADPTRLKNTIGCKRILVYVERDDELRERGVKYFEALKESGWEGQVELVESKGGGHVFYMWKLQCDAAMSLVCKIASFINN